MYLSHWAFFNRQILLDEPMDLEISDTPARRSPLLSVDKLNTFDSEGKNFQLYVYRTLLSVKIINPCEKQLRIAVNTEQIVHISCWFSSYYWLEPHSKYLFILLCQVLVVASRTFTCSMWDLVPWPGIEPGSPALGAWNLSHWTTRKSQSHILERHDISNILEILIPP